MANMGMLFASVAIIPAAATSPIPTLRPNACKGLLNTFVITLTIGNAPNNTMAIAPTISIPAQTGAIPGIITTPVSVSQTIAARPIVIIITTALPKYWNAVVILSGKNHRPMAINTATITTGNRLPTTRPRLHPATKPPAMVPKGMVMNPASIPKARNLRSLSSMIPRATGIEKTIVGPIIAPRMIPAYRPTSGLRASSLASGYPPMSLANNVVANMAGSAPRNW